VADIPFAFVANQTVMSAGRYTVKRANASGGVFTLYSASGTSVITSAMKPATGSPNKPHLTFACYGKECVLAEIAPEGSEMAYTLAQRSIEKNLHHTLGMAAMVSIKFAAR
jgi:hypothetical protein